MKWWVYRNGSVSEKPYSLSELKQAEWFGPKTRVCGSDNESWTEAEQVAEFEGLFDDESEPGGDELNLPGEMEQDILSKQRKKQGEKVKLTQSVLNLFDCGNYSLDRKTAADFMAGKRTEKLIENNLTADKRHGCVGEYTARQLRLVIKKFINKKLLREKEVMAGTRELEITEKGREVLSGEDVPEFSIPSSMN